MTFAHSLKFKVLAAAVIAASLSFGDAHAQRGKDKEHGPASCHPVILAGGG